MSENTEQNDKKHEELHQKYSDTIGNINQETLALLVSFHDVHKIIVSIRKQLRNNVIVVVPQAGSTQCGHKMQYCCVV